MPDNDYLGRQLQWLIKLRWVAVLGAFIAAFAVRAPGYFTFPLAPVSVVLGFAACCNVLATLLAKRYHTRLLTIALLQIVLDQTTLGIILYLTGACLSPFLYFFLFHVVISGILLPHRSTVLIASLAAAIPTAVVGLSHFSVLPHYDIFNQSASRVVDVPAFLIHGTAYLATLGLTAYFVVFLNRRLLISHQDLERSNLKLSTLVTASHTVSQLSELEGVLSRSFQTILNNPEIAAHIVIPTEEHSSWHCYDYLSCNRAACPAYHTEATCWHLMGTLCARNATCSPLGEDRAHSGPTDLPARTYDDVVNSCTSCKYFTMIVAMRIDADVQQGAAHPLSGSADDRTALLLQAMRDGQCLARTGARMPVERPSPDIDALAFPFKLHDRLSGLLLLTSRYPINCTEDTLAFIRLLSEVTATGLFGANLFEYLETSYLQLVLALANAVEAKDPYTRGHSERVAFYSILIAVTLGLTKQEKEHLSFAALLHDIGKIGTNLDILHKQGKLAADEQEAIMSHALIGSRILDPVHFLKPIIAAVRHHHENYDGTGYPSGLKGDDIPLQARIVKIADTWDAMTSDRPYRRALPKNKAREELVRCSGTQFDPLLVKVFLENTSIHDE